MKPIPLQSTRRAGSFGADDFHNDVIGHKLLVDDRHRTRPARQMIVLCVLLIGAFLVWAATTPVYQVVTGSGTLLPSQGLRKVQHLEGGIVEAVLVAPGDRVEAGDVLIRLDRAQLQSELERTEARLSRLDLSIERLHALADGGKTRLADTAESLRESQSAALAGARMHLETQLQLIASERDSLTAQFPMLERRRTISQRELDLVRTLLDQDQDSLDRGLATRFRRDESARDALGLQRSLAEVDGDEAKVASDLAQLSAREAELRSGWQRDAYDEIATLEAERTETRAQQRQLQDRLSRLAITAPVSGRINILNAEGPGEVVAPGQAVAVIVPGGGPVYARIEIPASRIGGVTKDMEATLKILTYDYTRFGDIQATVSQVSPSSILTEDGEQVFEVRLKLDTTHLGPVEAGIAALPGMTAAAEIVTERNSLLSYILKPVRILKDRAFS